MIRRNPLISQMASVLQSLLLRLVSAVEMIGRYDEHKWITYPHPRRITESRRGRGLDGCLCHGELAGEAREGALTGVTTEERAEEVTCLHEVGAPRLVRSRRGQQSRGPTSLPWTRLK